MTAAAERLQAQDIILAEGTAVSISLAKDVSSKDAQRGDKVNFTVDEDLVADGQVIIKKGTLATGSVIYAEKGGYMGKSGKLALQVESTITSDGESIPLRAALGGEGNAKTGTALALSFIPGPFGILKKGDNTILKEGTKITVYTGEKRRFRIEETKLVAVKADNNTTDAASDKKVTVYIYRRKSIVGAALEPSVFCDDVNLARMDNGRYFVLTLAPGKHVIHMTDDKKGYELNMAAGQTYYFRVGIEAGMWKGSGKILLDDEEKGASEVKKLKPLDAEKIKDKTMVVPN